MRQKSDNRVEISAKDAPSLGFLFYRIQEWCMEYYTYIRPKNQPNAGKYTIHWIYPVAVPNEGLGWDPYSKKKIYWWWLH